MSAHRQVVSGQLKSFPGSRQVSAIISTETTDRAGDVVRSQGCDYAGFLASGTVLWNHDQNQPIARAISIRIGLGQITSVCQFPEPGISAKSDEVYGLIKAGVINATSVGFLPTASKPIGKGQVDVSKWILLEWSFVSCPANDMAVITQRAMAAGWLPPLSADEEARLQRTISLMILGGPSVDSELMARLPADRQHRIRTLELYSLTHPKD